MVMVDNISQNFGVEGETRRPQNSTTTPKSTTLFYGNFVIKPRYATYLGGDELSSTPNKAIIMLLPRQ